MSQFEIPVRAMPAAHPRLSALVVAHDEEAMLPGCLESLAFADEIVVVLDRCTDGSKAVAERFGARIIEGAWPIEGDRRNLGIEACGGDWILEVDADERVSPALAAEILTVLPDAEPGYFGVPFNNYVGGRLVRYGWGAYNGVMESSRLFAKGCKRWGRQEVHPKLEFRGQKRLLQSRMEHLVDRDLRDMFDRLNRYTDAAAKMAIRMGDRPSGWHSVRRIVSRFWKSYVSRKGWKEGEYGIALALFSALYPMLTYLKVRETLRREAGEDQGA